MTYNSDGFPDTYYFSMYDNPAPADTNIVTKYAYSDGKVTTDSVWQKEGGVWSFVFITHHYYNATGKLVSDSNFSIVASSPELSYVTSLTYYPDEMLKSVVSTYFDGSSIVQTKLDTLGYTAGSNYATYWENRSTSSFTGNTTIFKEIRFPGANGLPDSAKAYTTTSSSTNGRTYRYTYNAFNNPEVLSIFSEGNSTSIPNQTIKFYYETYDDGLSIKEQTPGTDLDIYPNPFNRYFSLKCKSAHVGRYKLRLVNTFGIEVFATSLSLNAGVTKVDLPELSAGFYNLIMQNEKGETITKKLIRK